MQHPASDFGPEVWIFVAIVAVVLIAIGFAMRKFAIDVEPIGARALPLQDHSHSTPFE